MRVRNPAEAKKVAQQYMTQCTIVASTRLIFTGISILTAILACIAAYIGWHFGDRLFAFAAIVLLIIEAIVFGVTHAIHSLGQRRRYKQIVHDAEIGNLNFLEMEIPEPESFPLTEFFAEQANQRRWTKQPSSSKANAITMTGILAIALLLLMVTGGISYLVARYLPTGTPSLSH